MPDTQDKPTPPKKIPLLIIARLPCVMKSSTDRKGHCMCTYKCDRGRGKAGIDFADIITESHLYAIAHPTGFGSLFSCCPRVFIVCSFADEWQELCGDSSQPNSSTSSRIQAILRGSPLEYRLNLGSPSFEMDIGPEHMNHLNHFPPPFFILIYFCV